MQRILNKKQINFNTKYSIHPFKIQLQLLNIKE